MSEHAEPAALFKDIRASGRWCRCLVAIVGALACKPAVADPTNTQLLQKACDGGDMWACSNLGVRYEQSGVRDAAKAAALFQKACDGGETESCFHLGVRYEEGNGGVRDAAKAAALYHKACDGGEMAG
jgi:TPR repeat protein